MSDASLPLIEASLLPPKTETPLLRRIANIVTKQHHRLSVEAHFLVVQCQCRDLITRLNALPSDKKAELGKKYNIIF